MDNKDESKLLVEALDKIVAHQEHCGHHNSFIANTAKRALLEHAAQKEWNNIWNLSKGEYHKLKAWYVASMCANNFIYVDGSKYQVSSNVFDYDLKCIKVWVI